VPGATLAIAGQGPLHSTLMQRIKTGGLAQAVTLLGPKKRSEVARLMRDDCDIFVLPSNSETFGVVLIEALACGKPVVATDCGGPRDIVTDSALGLLCRPRDADSVYEALRQTIAKLPTYDLQAIRQHAAQNYDYLSLAARLDKEYDAILGDKAK
jgi:glycosyltransferase involved in cell wall biosynthesis